MSDASYFPKVAKVKISSVDTSGDDDTYTLAEAIGGDVLILAIDPYNIDAATAPMTNISIQTDDTTPLEILSSANGAQANLTAQKHMPVEVTRPFLLASGKRIKATITNPGWVGNLNKIMRVTIYYLPISGSSI